MKIEEHKQIIMDIINGVKNNDIGEVTKCLSTLSEDYARISGESEKLTKDNNDLNEKIKSLKSDNLDLYIKCSGLENTKQEQEQEQPEEQEELTEDEAFAKLWDDKGKLL